MRYAILLAVSCGCFYALTGCAGTLQRQGGFTLVTDAEGLHAWADSQIGLINETRTDATIKGSYWQNRELQTKAKGIQLGRANNGK